MGSKYKSILNKLKNYGELVMFTNTLFSLSFGIIAMILAANGLPPFATTFWICLALLTGRTAANALNRVVDRNIDAKDPRTAQRQIPSGKLSAKEVMVFVVINFLLLFIATAMLPPICLMLLPIAMVLFIVYSYSKRFTWLCHLILGFGCAVAPAGAWIGVTGSLSFPGLVLTAADVFWVAGFDIIYAIQDRKFDKSQGLHSIPVKFGETTALHIGKIFHIITFILLFSLTFFTSLGWIYAISVFIVGGFLIYEHLLVSPNNYKKVIFASYSINKIISVILLMGFVLDMLWH
ncbi:MAG: UbiA-like polyprenyltransferase [Clostridiales bacterium]